MDKEITQGCQNIALTSRLSKLEKETNSVLENIQVGGVVNIPQSLTNSNGRDSKNSYVEGLSKP